MASAAKSPGILLRNAGIFNPVLVQAVGLCPVIAMATSVKSAALLAAVSAIIITLSELIASLFLKPIPRWIRIGIYIIIGGATVAPLMILIERVNAPLFGSLGIYLPIMAVNSLNVLRCERFAVKTSPSAAFLDGLTASVGYSAVLIIVGFFRELLGSGSIFGFRFFEGRTLSGLLLPFGGFLMLGFASAALRSLISKFWPKYLDKKQPKPGSKKKHEVKVEKKDKPKAEPITPEFTADETPFTLEDITSDKTEEAAKPLQETETKADAEPTSPSEDTSQTQEASAETDIPPAEENEQTATVEAKDASEVQTDTSTHEKIPTYHELTLDDISNDASEESAPADSSVNSFTDSDDELEALMNRSIGDVLVNPTKEDEEE